MVHQDTITISTDGHGDMHRIEDELQTAVARSGVRTGLVHAFNVGSTGAIGMIEYEPGLIEDLPAILNKLIPPGRHYGHEQTWHDGNAHSHLQASLLGPEVTVPIRDGALALGTWQQIIHLECDVRPRQREIIVTITGD